MNVLNKDRLVGVVGAGAMGSGIAQVALQAGHPVAIYDACPGAAADAVDRLKVQLTKLVQKEKMSATFADDCNTRLHAVEELGQLAHAGLVIEAIVENLEIKCHLLKSLEDYCDNDCILATNTSSLSVTALGAGLRSPERLVGMHFFNPAPLMSLVEVVSGVSTDPALAEQVYQTAWAWGKKPVHTKSTPGFIVNRVARPFYAESFRLLQEGASDAPTLDALMRDAGGFRMGAFELTDLIGHDVNYAVTNSVYDAFYNDKKFLPSFVQKELVDGGLLGRKTGRGFYRYQESAEFLTVEELSSNSLFDTYVVEGELGPANALIERAQKVGMQGSRRVGSGFIRVGDAVLALSDGRLAVQRAQDEGIENLVLFDLALDYSTTTRLGLTWAGSTSEQAVKDAVGFFKQLGVKTSPLADVPGMAVLRTVAMLCNEAADAVYLGVAVEADVDLAMKAGVNYPMGPLAWANKLGLNFVLKCLENIQVAYHEERYRPSLLLRRTALEHQLFLR